MYNYNYTHVREDKKGKGKGKRGMEGVYQEVRNRFKYTVHVLRRDQGKEGDRERRGGYGEKRGIGRKGVRTKRLQIIYFSCILLK